MVLLDCEQSPAAGKKKEKNRKKERLNLISYCKILRSKNHYVKVLQKTFHLNANEGLSITFMSNGKRELIPRDQHVTNFPLCLSPTVHYCTLVVSSNFLSIRIF